jgi:hypothetical protein
MFDFEWKRERDFGFWILDFEWKRERKMERKRERDFEFWILDFEWKRKRGNQRSEVGGRRPAQRSPKILTPDL